jgi:hypothetical protein
MALVAWLDCFERIDTLVLDIRHIQETIASQLKEKVFYAVFEYEDAYIWGRWIGTPHPGSGSSESGDWSDVLTKLPRDNPMAAQDCAMLATVWCPEFPAPEGYSVLYNSVKKADERLLRAFDRYFNRSVFESVTNELTTRRSEISRQNLFSASDDQLYYALRHLQLLKRDLLRDKLLLAQAAQSAFFSADCSNEPNRRKDRFFPLVLLRSAVMERLHAALAALRDFLSTVQDTFSLSIERDPPPSVRRRRDQGIYTTDLADNCRHFSSEILELLGYLKRSGRGGTTERRHYDLSESDLDVIVHRYARSRTSTARYDTLSRGFDLPVPAGSAPVPTSVGFVRSSYWMPERPDLQPVITHEVAHLLLIRHYGNLDPVVLAGKTDSLAHGLLRLNEVMERYAPRYQRYQFTAEAREALLREFGCDIISISIHGTAYMFAQFLELLGTDFGWLFRAQAGKPSDPTFRAGIVELVRERMTALRQQPPGWIARLCVATSFLRALEPDPDPLTALVIEGIEVIVDNVGAEISAMLHDELLTDWDNWHWMTRSLVDCVGRLRLPKRVAEWKRRRTKEAHITERPTPAVAARNRYMPMLPPSIADLCLKAWLDRLVEPPRLLGRQLFTQGSVLPLREPLREAFDSLYLGARPYRSVRYKTAPHLSLFNSLTDISWQCAMLTTVDFLGDYSNRNDPLDRGQWITAAHELNWIGRHLYHIALEYVVWSERPSIGRLKAMSRWLGAVVKPLESVASPSADATIGGWARSWCDTINRIRGAESRISEDRQAIIQSALRLNPSWPSASWSDDNNLLAPEKILSLADIRLGDFGFPASFSGPTFQSFIDFIASNRMNGVAEVLYVQLRAMFDDPEIRQQLEGMIAREWDSPVADNEIGQTFLAAVKELIRVFHYLSITPKSAPRSAIVDYASISGRGSPWADVFAKYLDVAVEPRKFLSIDQHNAAVNYLNGTISARPIRVDRICQSYSVVDFICDDDDLPGRDFPQADREEMMRPGHRVSDRGEQGNVPIWQSWAGAGLPSSSNPYRAAPYHLTTKLLGRFDCLTLGVARHTERFVQFSPRQAYFRRQQIGLPFGAEIKDNSTPSQSVGRPASNDRLESHRGFAQFFHSPKTSLPRPTCLVPLATISILLSQRSARLSFVERLICEDRFMRWFHPSLRSPFRYFNPSKDIGLLTDGWGDLFLLLFADSAKAGDGSFGAYCADCEGVRERLSQIVRLRDELFEDALVVRTETSYTPLAIDAALLAPDRYQCNLSLRFRTSIDGSSLTDSFYRKAERILRESLGDGLSLGEILALARVSGRYDYSILTKPEARSERATAIFGKLMQKQHERRNEVRRKYDLGVQELHFRSVYGVIYEGLRRELFEGFGQHIDSTTTTISELAEPPGRAACEAGR